MQLPRLHPLDNGFIADLGRDITIRPGAKRLMICLDVDAVNGPEDIRHLPAKVIGVVFDELVVAVRLSQIVLKEIVLDLASND